MARPRATRGRDLQLYHRAPLFHLSFSDFPGRPTLIPPETASTQEYSGDEQLSQGTHNEGVQGLEGGQEGCRRLEAARAGHLICRRGSVAMPAVHSAARHCLGLPLASQINI